MMTTGEATRRTVLWPPTSVDVLRHINAKLEEGEPIQLVVQNQDYCGHRELHINVQSMHYSATEIVMIGVTDNFDTVNAYIPRQPRGSKPATVVI